MGNFKIDPENSMPTLKNILIVSPAFNEGTVLPEFITAFLSMRGQLSGKYDLRLLVVNDGSTDETENVLKSLALSHAGYISCISFIANFGYQAALSAGLLHGCKWADAIVTMDCDLEHPFEVVPQLIAEWETNHCVVVNTVRDDHKGLALRKRIPSRLFYVIAARLTGLELTVGQADFRIWDGAVVRAMSEYLPSIGSLRIFAAWLPGKKKLLSYKQNVRADRRTRFTFKKNWDMAVISIVRFSTLPLKSIFLVGLLGLIVSFVYGAFVFYEAFMGRVVPGWASTILVILGMGSLQLFSLGVLATYLQRLVFAKDLPPFVLRSKTGFLSDH